MALLVVQSSVDSSSTVFSHPFIIIHILILKQKFNLKYIKSTCVCMKTHPCTFIFVGKHIKHLFIYIYLYRFTEILHYNWMKCLNQKREMKCKAKPDTHTQTIKMLTLVWFNLIWTTLLSLFIINFIHKIKYMKDLSHTVCVMNFVNCHL